MPILKPHPTKPLSLRAKRAFRSIPLLPLLLCVLAPTGQAQQSAADEPFAVVERTWEPQDLLSRQARAGAPIWLDDGVLSFFHRAAAESVKVVGSVTVPMKRIADTDLWTVSIELPGLSRAVIRYRFEADGSGQIIPAELAAQSYRHWRGPDAPDPVERAASLSGRIDQHTLESRRLEESWDITIYLPPEHRADGRYPVIYQADGQDTPDYASVLEALILKKKVPPTILIGVHSGKYQGDKDKPIDPSKVMRSVEYLTGYEQMVSGADTSRFADHEHFFLHEVGAWAEKNLGASADRSDRLYFGVSNGGDFGISLGIRNPGHFANILAFSAGWQPAVTPPDWDSNAYPRFYLAVGTLDGGYFKNTSRWSEILKEKNFEHVLRHRVSGHDPIMWQEEFARAVVWALARD